MALPTGGGAWPPTTLDMVTARLDVWSAWYSGDPDRLALLYGGSLAGDPGRPLGSLDTDLRGWRGWLGRLAQRWFWGTQTPANEKRTKLHLPLAGDIASTSADLLFSEPPTFSVEDDETTQKRLDELVEDGLHADLLEAAEVCAALGGVYLRVCWDDKVRDRPWISAIHADCAIPTWQYGRLKAVTFWRIVKRQGNDVWRHLERHEPGFILNGLYQGADADLGKLVPLDSLDETTGIPDARPTGVKDGLTACYVPNMRPSRVWREIPEGAHLGRSDFAGTEGLMDALDEVYSSLMRDIRLAKGKLIIPESYLQSLGQGKGAAWDSEQELIYPVAALQSPNASGSGLMVTPNQFQIRVNEHLQSAQALQDQIVRACGYSAQTFGSATDGSQQVAQTATEVDSRTRRSEITRDRKITYWSPALAEILRVLLAVDASAFRSGVNAVRPTVEFGDRVSEDPQALAQTAQLLRAAEAASTETLVQMVHPDWDDTQVQEEVQRIQDEAAPPPPPEIVPGPADAGMGADAGPGAQPTADQAALDALG